MHVYVYVCVHAQVHTLVLRRCQWGRTCACGHVCVYVTGSGGVMVTTSVFGVQGKVRMGVR